MLYLSTVPFRYLAHCPFWQNLHGAQSLLFISFNLCIAEHISINYIDVNFRFFHFPMQHQHQLPSSDESRTITEEKHQFKRQSFLIPTVCVYCDNRVWTGLKRSAFQCQSTCQRTTHRGQTHEHSHFRISSSFFLIVNIFIIRMWRCDS